MYRVHLLYYHRSELNVCIDNVCVKNKWNHSITETARSSWWLLYFVTVFVIPTVYPKKYAHGFVVLCFVVVMQSFIMNSHEVFIHIHQGCFAGTGAIVRLPQCQWSKPGGYGIISRCITKTKHSKAKTACIFLGIYCKPVTVPLGNYDTAFFNALCIVHIYLYLQCLIPYSSSHIICYPVDANLHCVFNHCCVCSSFRVASMPAVRYYLNGSLPTCLWYDSLYIRIIWLLVCLWNLCKPDMVPVSIYGEYILTESVWVSVEYVIDQRNLQNKIHWALVDSTCLSRWYVWHWIGPSLV